MRARSSAYFPPFEFGRMTVQLYLHIPEDTLWSIGLLEVYSHLCFWRWLLRLRCRAQDWPRHIAIGINGSGD